MTTKASSIPHQIPRDLQKILTAHQLDRIGKENRNKRTEIIHTD